MFFPNPLITLRLEFERKFGTAAFNDAAIVQYMYIIGLDVIQHTLIVGDYQRAHIGSGQRIHTICNDTQRVNIQAGVGFIENRNPRLQNSHLQYFSALLFAAAETFIEVTPGK